MVIYHIVVLIDGLNRWKGGMWLITDFLPRSLPFKTIIYLQISYFADVRSSKSYF